MLGICPASLKQVNSRPQKVWKQEGITSVAKAFSPAEHTRRGILEKMGFEERRKMEIVKAEMKTLGFMMVGPISTKQGLKCVVYHQTKPGYRELEISRDYSTVKVHDSEDQKAWNIEELMTGNPDEVARRIWPPEADAATVGVLY